MTITAPYLGRVPVGLNSTTDEIPFFDHSVDCKGRVRLSMFWLRKADEYAPNIKLARFLLIWKTLLFETEPKAHVHILRSSVTHLLSLKSIRKTVFVRYSKTDKSFLAFIEELCLSKKSN